jgi:predicted Fe-S protein YdhL (DUF1289 family)
MIGSPCTRVCRLIDGSDICAGCWRKLTEIASWPDLTDAERLAILADLPNRRAEQGSTH